MLVLPDPHTNAMLFVLYFHSSTGTYRVISIYDGEHEGRNSNCHVNKDSSYVYYAELKLLQKLPKEYWFSTIPNLATPVSLKGMQPEKHQCRNELKKVSGSVFIC